MSIFGLLTILNVSSVFALTNFNDSFHFFKLQSIWTVVAIVVQIILSKINYNYFKKISILLISLSVVFLTLVLFPSFGKMINGSRRWLQLGFFVFQPSEFAKIALAIYFSSYFEKKNKLLPFLIIISVVLVLVMIEPDLGTATVILGMVFCLYFIAGAPIKPFMAVLSAFFIVGTILILFSPYRRQRMNTFLNYSSVTQESSYHNKQILISLGLGGFLGQGFGQSKQKNLFLPEVATDSIFAVIAEEYGFIGSTILILIYLFLIYRGFLVALMCNDKFGRLLSVSLMLILAFQVLINLGSMVMLFPLTGIPLPFISYGGTSLLVFHSAVGIVYNISRNI